MKLGIRSSVSGLAIVAAGASLLLPACGEDGSDGGGAGTSERPAGAILIAERFTTPDGRVMYMGAFPELPAEPVDISRLVELGEDGDAFACGGNAFFYDSAAATITRFEVQDDLSLVRGPTIQLSQEGVTGWTGAHVCASPTRAYIFNEAGGRVVEWDPEAMVIVDAFDVPLPEVASGMAIQYFEPFIAFNLVYFPVEAINWDTLEVSERAILATFDLTDESLTFSYDERCQSGLSGHVDAKGNFYRYAGYGAFFAEYSPQATIPPDCVLRVNAGTKMFDPSYVRELGSTRDMFAIDDEWALALVHPAGTELPSAEDPWPWFELPVAPTRVNLVTGETAAYAGLPQVAPMNSRKIRLDGENYYQVNSFDAEGRVTQTRLVRLTLDGPVDALVLEGGDVLTLERLW